jgi:uncharacterized OB-fold protein
MRAIHALLAQSEVSDVEQFLKFCERERVVSTSPMPIYRCDSCGRRAVPGQWQCTNCVEA